MARQTNLGGLHLANLWAVHSEGSFYFLFERLVHQPEELANSTIA